LLHISTFHQLLAMAFRSVALKHTQIRHFWIGTLSAKLFMSPAVNAAGERDYARFQGRSQMFSTTQSPFRTTATALAASLIGTALVVALPATSARAATHDSFVRNVEAQLNNEGWTPNAKTGVATVAVRIDADGKLLSAGIAASTGHTDLDRHALKTARSVAYPKGTGPRTVAVVLTFGKVAKASKAASAALVSRYANAKGEALAAEIPAPNAA
jgi:TonB family protein